MRDHSSTVSAALCIVDPLGATPRPCSRSRTPNRRRRSALSPKKCCVTLCRSILVGSKTQRSALSRPPRSSSLTGKMPISQRGEIWLIDFGMAGKTRPALIVSVTFGIRTARRSSNPSHLQPAWIANRDFHAVFVSQAGRVSGPGRYYIPTVKALQASV
jgi:hypothetical protein